MNTGKMTIQDLIQAKVNEYALEKWKEDECKPEFIVSILEDSLILTCRHMGGCFSESIFPIENMGYGLGSLTDTMEGLYNRTM